MKMKSILKQEYKLIGHISTRISYNSTSSEYLQLTTTLPLVVFLAKLFKSCTSGNDVG